MNKNIKQIISITLMLALIAGCFATLPIANAAPELGALTWDAKYATAKVIEPFLGPDMNLENNPRTDASGDKITSNAHSADYPGLYFYWNDKQKDNGVLLVAPGVFDLFVNDEFILTAKNSNYYWGYKITKDDGQLIEGIYAYGINKEFKYKELGNNGKISEKTEALKNINMVFIDGEYKPANLIIEKVWLDEEGEGSTGDNSLVKFNNPYALGENKIVIKTFAEATKGKTVTVTETPIKGFKTLDNPQSTKLTAGETKTLIFENQKEYAVVQVIKIWSDDFYELPVAQQNELKALLEFDAPFVFELGEETNIKDGTELKIKEVAKDWTYVVTTKTQIITYTVQWDDTEYDFGVAVAGESYEFVFTNVIVGTVKDKASVVVTKTWSGFFDELPKAQQKKLWKLLEFEAAFDFKLGKTKYVAEGTDLAIKEVVKDWTYVVETDTQIITYTVQWDDNEYDFGVAVAGEPYVFAFTNVIEKEIVDKEAYIVVLKNWINAAGESIDAPEGVTATFNNGQTFMEDTSSPIPVTAGETHIFVEDTTELHRLYKTVPTSDWRDVGAPRLTWGEETVLRTWTENGRVYTEYIKTATGTQAQIRNIETITYEFFSVNIDGAVSYTNEATIVVEGGNTYVITFTNKVIVTPDTEQDDRPITDFETRVTDKPLYDQLGKFIPSEAQSGNWWSEFGVIAVAGSSVTSHVSKPGYLVAFNDKAGDVIYIGYGTGIDALQFILSFDRDGNVKALSPSTGEEIPLPTTFDATYPGTVWVDSPRNDLNGVDVPVDILYIFANLFDSGARQAYLLKYNGP